MLKTITIGTQTWMAENLRTTHYRNGESILNVTSGTTWNSQTTGARCNFGNDTNKTMLYNWFAVTDTQNIAPVGWHVPSDAEWKILTTYLGGENVAGGKLESLGFATTGSRNANGGFEYPDFGDWWAASEISQTKGSHRGHPTGKSPLYNVGFDKRYGFAVRCVKDLSTATSLKKHIDGFKIYPNPTTSIINIVNDKPSCNTMFDLTDINGNRVYHIENSGNKYRLDLSDKPKGIYILSGWTGKERFNKKIYLQ